MLFPNRENSKMILRILVFTLASFVTSMSFADPLKIGFITTLTTKAGYLGEDIRDGFMLAVEQGNGQLGGVDVDVIVKDDELKPEKGIEIADKFVKKDGIQLMTGIVFSNVAMAVVPKVVNQDVVYISPNAGPSELAGELCHRNYFNVAWQNDNLHEVTGEYVNSKGYKSAYILAPNYRAGKDALAGFKRFYKGEIAGEVYTKLGQSDYSAELAALRAAGPDSVFFFLPGGMGINFVKQYAQAGLNESIPLFGPAFSFEERILGAVGDAAVGVMNGSQWSHDLDNPANNSFVAAFRAKYERTPTLYASQGYDAANLIASALSATSGDLSDLDGFRAALAKADFVSVRGNFKFGSNQHPIQDIYIREVVKDGDVVTNKVVARVFENHQDAYAGNCNL
jgi:branched-chain amino acid transport system substrate-binding protein